MSFLSQPLQDILLGPSRKVGPIALQVVITENTNDTLTITKQPVQQGASITDHAYMEPTVLSMVAYFKDNLSTSLSKIYKQLLDLQSDRVPFSIVTPKRIYASMLLSSLSQTTDKNTENCLQVNMSFQQVLIVSVSTVVVPRKNQKNAAVTAKTEAAGKKSVLVKGADAITGLFAP